MSLQVQFVTMGMMLCSGCLLGGIFDAIRVISSQMKLARWLLHIIDVGFGFASAVLVFRILYLANSGELRYFIFIGLILGIAIYFFWFSRPVVRLVQLLVKCLKKGFLAIAWLGQKLLILPLQLLYRLLLLLLGLVGSIAIFFYKIVIQCFYLFGRSLLWLIKGILPEPRWLKLVFRKGLKRIRNIWKR